jgi:uncharacterized protein Yka (UPF0111/DUF47 family)
MLFANNKDKAFYDLLDAQAVSAHQAATLFHALILDFSQMSMYLEKLEAIEHEADQLTHSFVNAVNIQFITPLDKEDMHALTKCLDDITDMIEKAAGYLDVYQLKAARPELSGLVVMLVGITKETQILVQLLRQGLKNKELPTIIAGINAMESRMDKSFRQALRSLFDDTGLDTRQLIQWKEVYELIEQAVNRCEKVADLVESLIVKYT